MIKTIFFVRHGQPLKDYSEVSYEEFMKRVLKKNDVSINRSLYQESLIYSKVSNIEVIFHSPLLRSIETATMIKNKVDVELDLIETNLLREIDFNEDLVTREEFALGGFELGRLKLLRSILNDTNHAEPLDKALKRVENLLELVSFTEFSNILCITHAYFMRIIKLFIVRKMQPDIKLTFDEIDKLKDDYFNGFGVIFENDHPIKMFLLE